MSLRRVGGFAVAPIGLGCMGLSHAYAAPPGAAETERLPLAALDLGVTLFDTTARCGFGVNENLGGCVLIGHRSASAQC